MAEPEAHPETNPEPPAAPPPGRSSRLVPLLLTVNTALLLVVAAGVGLLAVRALRPAAPAHQGAGGERPSPTAALQHETPEKPPDRQDRKEGPGAMVRLADFVVHLRDADVDRYARMSFEIELPDEKAKEALGARMPQIRDAFLAFLSDRTSEDLRGSDAMARVKSALVQRLAEVAPGAGVRGLYLTELVVQ